MFIVALLGVLVGALAAGSGGFATNTDRENVRLLATQIIQQMQTVKTAVERVRGNGCTDEEISFENSILSGYVNPNSPLTTMPWCHVFHPQGGGLVWLTPPRDALDWTISNYATGQRGTVRYYAVRHNGRDGASGTVVGTSAWCGTQLCGNDFLAETLFVRRDVCIYLNELLGVSNPSGNPPTQFYQIDGNQWTGSGPRGTWWAANFSESYPVMAGCVEGYNALAGMYRVFQVLVVR